MSFYNEDAPTNHKIKTDFMISMMGLPVDNLDVCRKAGWYPIEYRYLSFDDCMYRQVPVEELVYDAEKKVYIQNFKLEELDEDDKKERLFRRLRNERNKKLEETDVYLIADYPISASDLEAVKTYRTTLRNLPEQKDAPWDGGKEATPWPVNPMNKEENNG